jgi:hypothetical protein
MGRVMMLRWDTMTCRADHDTQKKTRRKRHAEKLMMHLNEMNDGNFTMYRQKQLLSG